MATSPNANLKRATFGLLTASILSGAIALGTTTAVSQAAGCSGDHVATTDGAVLASYQDAQYGFETSRTYAVNVPAGQYDLNGAGGDSYTGRAATDAQGSEQWFAQVLDVSGNVLATSGTTADLADGVEAASWAGGLGLVNLSADATAVRVVHAHQTDQETNSVYPTCVGFTAFAEPVVDTTPIADVVADVIADVVQPVAQVAGTAEVARPSFTG